MSMRFELTGECAAVNLVNCLCPNGSQTQRRAERGLVEEVGALGSTNPNEGVPVRTDRRKCTDWEENGRVR